MVVGKQTCAAVVNQKQIGGLLFFFFQPNTTAVWMGLWGSKSNEKIL